MTDFDLDNVEPRAEHFDLISAPERLLCWGFELARLTEVYGDYYSPGVFKALLEGLKELSESKNARLRESQFVVWGGDHFESFSVGVPADLSADVTEVLRRHLRGVVGYHTEEIGHFASLSVTALFRYDRGRFIEYSDDSAAGQEGSDKYGAGVKVSYRLLG